MIPPTPAQVERWESFKGVAKRRDIEIRATMIRFQQLQTLHNFLTANNLPVNFDAPGIAAAAQNLYQNNERLKRCIEQVELGFSGWFVFIAGVIVVYAAIEVLADMSQRNHDLYEKATRVIEHADTELCADPQSQKCIDWNKAKADNNFDEQHGTIFGLFDEAKNWPNKVKPALAGLTTGLIIAAVAVGIFLLWDKKRGR
jgi:hypothetical protein